MDERYRTSETNMFLLEFRIKGFWDPKALQWGGMIQGVICHKKFDRSKIRSKRYNGEVLVDMNSMAQKSPQKDFI